MIQYKIKELWTIPQQDEEPPDHFLQEELSRNWQTKLNKHLVFMPSVMDCKCGHLGCKLSSEFGTACAENSGIGNCSEQQSN